MESYLKETSYTFLDVSASLSEYVFDPQLIPFLAGYELDTFLYPYSIPSSQPPMPLVSTPCPLTHPTNYNTDYKVLNSRSESPPSAFSPASNELFSPSSSELFDFARSPTSSSSSSTTTTTTTTSPRSPPTKDLKETEAWGPVDLHQMGYLDVSGKWRCRYSGCCSSRVFLRACDLRKHFRGHAKYFFCTETRCQQAGVGFATRKDFQRHMGSHKPAVPCLHPDCDRIFSRKDNMVS